MTKKDLFNAINNMDEKYIHDAQDVYKQPQAPEVIRVAEEKRQPYWKTIFATVVCTAAAMFAVFVPIARSGAVGFLAPADTQSSDSGSGVTLSSSSVSENSNVMGSEIKIDLEKEKEYDVVLDSVFVYDKDSDSFIRCEWGDKFGSDNMLMGGKAYFRKNNNGDLQLYRQELSLLHFMSLRLDCSFIKSTEEGTLILLRESLPEALGLPNFFKTSLNEIVFELNAEKFIGNMDSKTISIRSINITVDYDTNNITFSSDMVTAF